VPATLRKLRGAVAQADAQGVQQLMYYDRALATGRFDRLRGGAFGWGIKKKILDAYSFLMINYEPGQMNFFFLGFSRGAYTVRGAFFGLIRK